MILYNDLPSNHMVIVLSNLRAGIRASAQSAKAEYSAKLNRKFALEKAGDFDLSNDFDTNNYLAKENQ